MDIKTINDRLSVGPQITPAEVAELARRGFRTIICNRPDDEDPDQPSFAEIAAAAASQGLAARHIPVVPGAMSDAQVDEFGAALRELPGPAYAFCRTGSRAAALASKGNDTGQPPS